MSDVAADENMTDVAAASASEVDRPWGHVDPVEVTRLTAYFREELFTAETADGRKWSISRDDYYEMVRAVDEHPMCRLRSEAGGRHDYIYRVTRRALELDAPRDCDLCHRPPAVAWQANAAQARDPETLAAAALYLCIACLRAIQGSLEPHVVLGPVEWPEGEVS